VRIALVRRPEVAQDFGVRLLGVAALSAALALGAATTTAAAVKPKPYQWTASQAVAAIRAHGKELYVEQERFLPRDLVSLTCRGTGKSVAGRFTSFRCAATFEPSGSPDTVLKEYRATFTVRTRKAGGLCWSTAVIPSACLAPGKRARGSVAQAYRAMAPKVGTLDQSFYCLANGAGFYSCSWMTAERAHHGTVVFSPSPVARVID
jgi:hypothetical protein